VVRLGKRVDEDYNSSIDVEWNHNHSDDSLHSLSFKDIPINVTNTITQLSPMLVVYCLGQLIENFYVS
jgi:hypothetical protein